MTETSKPNPSSSRIIRLSLGGSGLLLTLLLLVAGAGATMAISAPLNELMPEFRNQSPTHWVNSPPLKRADLKGKVVLIEIWTSV